MREPLGSWFIKQILMIIEHPSCSQSKLYIGPPSIEPRDVIFASRCWNWRKLVSEYHKIPSTSFCSNVTKRQIEKWWCLWNWKKMRKPLIKGKWFPKKFLYNNCKIFKRKLNLEEEPSTWYLKYNTRYTLGY